MEPVIRYARTRDGLDIACYAHGAGPAVVSVQYPFSHLQAEQRDPDRARAFATVARLATLVRYDPRGFGLSDRSADSFTLEELCSDLEAVVERLKLESFLLFAGGDASPMALRYVATNPGRVTHLVLYPGFVQADGIDWRRWESLAPMAADDWSFVSDAMVRATFAWESEEASRRGADLLREAVTPQTLVKYMAHARGWDASAYVADVTVPTLLLQETEAGYTTMDAARRLLSDLRDGRLVLIEGATASDRGNATFAGIAEFIGLRLPPVAEVTQPENREAGSLPPPRTGTGTATASILFADVVDSTAIAGQIGNAAFRGRTRQLEEALRGVIREAGGAPVEGRTLGDGVIGVFTSAAQAIEAALQCSQHADGVGLELHLGIHAGDVIHESGNISGVAVSIAARISDLTGPNEILVSSTVRDLARASTGVTFEDRGEHALKGVADAPRVFAVRAADP